MEAATKEMMEAVEAEAEVEAEDVDVKAEPDPSFVRRAESHKSQLIRKGTAMLTELARDGGVGADGVTLIGSAAGRRASGGGARVQG